MLETNLVILFFLFVYREKGVSVFDLSRIALTTHTKRIFEQIYQKSSRKVEQFTFGTTYAQLNPNYPKFDRLDPTTWKKDGILRVWSGMRGYRRICCKNCCSEYSCQVKNMTNNLTFKSTIDESVSFQVTASVYFVDIKF